MIGKSLVDYTSEDGLRFLVDIPVRCPDHPRARDLLVSLLVFPAEGHLVTLDHERTRKDVCCRSLGMSKILAEVEVELEARPAAR